MPPSLAVCVGGAVRSFPRQAFRQSFAAFRKRMTPLDVFVVLKMSCHHGTLLNSAEGVEHFLLTVRALRPKAVILFDRFEDEKINASSYASQMLTIDAAFGAAQSHKPYDYYMRYRPDFIMMEDARLPWPPESDTTIYTTRKMDAPASDQAFLISGHLKEAWWDRLSKTDTHLCCPEYAIFQTSFAAENGPHFRGGLLRGGERESVVSWDQRTWRTRLAAALRVVLHPEFPWRSPGQSVACPFVQQETVALPVSHEPVQPQFRAEIHRRMQELAATLGFSYTYHDTLGAPTPE